MLRDFRKPLIIAGPKLLLRHPSAVSSFSDMISGTSFVPVLDDVRIINTDQVSTVYFTSGKIYYDLVKECGENNDKKDYVFIRYNIY